MQTLDLCVADGLERIARQMGYAKVTHMLEILASVRSARRLQAMSRTELRVSRPAVADAGLVRGAWSWPLRSSAAELESRAMRAAAVFARTGVAMLVMQRGRVVFEDYPNGHSARGNAQDLQRHERLLDSGGAQGRGGRGARSRRAGRGDDSRNGAGDRGKARVTIRQLLNFCSGLDAANQLHGDDFADRDAIALRTSLVAPPGSAFIYGPGAIAGLS